MLADMDVEVERSVVAHPKRLGFHRGWSEVASDLPSEVVDYIRGHLYMPGYRVTAVEGLEERLGINRRTQDRARVRLLWERAVIPRHKDRTMRIVREAVDNIKRTDHIGRLVEVRVATDIPNGEPKDGVLHVADPKRTRGAIVLRSYLEVTPPEVIVHAASVLRTERARLGLPKRRIRAWDITAGSCTALTVITALGGRVISSDLVCPCDPVITLDARNIGSLSQHRSPRQTVDGGSWWPQLIPGETAFSRPHIIFFDPPSRGYPTHAELYDQPENASSDLAALDREDWIGQVTRIVGRASKLLAPGGVVSLPVRGGERQGEVLEPDPTVVDDIRDQLIAEVSIIEEVRVEYSFACRQASANDRRLPMSHLVLRRRS